MGISNFACRKTGYLILYLALFLLLILIVIACSSAPRDTGQSKLVILNHSMTVQNFVTDRPSSVAVVSGSAVNNGQETIPIAVISVEFKNSDGKVIAKGTASVENLKPGDTWNFSVQSYGTEAWKISTYEISVLRDK